MLSIILFDEGNITARISSDIILPLCVKKDRCNYNFYKSAYFIPPNLHADAVIALSRILISDAKREIPSGEMFYFVL